VKDLSFLFNKWSWLLLHGGIFAALALSVIFFGPVRINTNLFDILPPSRGLKAVAAADKVLSDKSSRHVNILIGSAGFEDAKRGAEELYDALNGNGFESLSLHIDENISSQFTGYLYSYRYVLLDKETRTLLEEGKAEAVASDALSSIYGAFTFAGLETIENDPFFLSDRETRSLLNSSLPSSGSMSLKENVLAAQYDGVWYVMLRGILASKGVALTNDDSAVQKIYNASSGVLSRNSGLNIIYSGVPFHSYESSSSAQKEISLISTITLIIIIIMFLFVFRSLAPALVSVAAAGISVALAVASALLVFREIHVLTFVFGTTLIGTCVDYSIHYFVHSKGNQSLDSGAAVRSHIIRGISLSFISTEICFAALLFAPFVILRQFAVFSLAGLLSSYFSVNCLYPSIKRSKRQRRLSADRFYFYIPGKIKRIILLVIFITVVIILVINRNKVRIENNLGGLYSMSGKLLESEKISAKVMNVGSVGWYFIVSGATAEETLQHEEILREKLDAEIDKGNIKSYLATSVFIPSVKTQKRNFAAVGKLLPLAGEQYANLGFPPGAAVEFQSDFEAAEGKYVFPEGEIPPYAQELISELWIGRAGLEKEGQGYFSCVLPFHVKDEALFRAVAADLDFVVFVNKAKDIGTELDALTKIMLFLFLGAYVLVAVMARFFYPWGKALRICAVPFFLILVTVTVLTCLDIPLGFFSVVGLILVFGLGLDYMFYVTEAERNETGKKGSALTVLAIFLSFATTALSFGALALSTFMPVHIFGLAVFSGLTAAFVSSMLVTSRAVDTRDKVQ
jgi:predicted exporter